MYKNKPLRGTRFLLEVMMPNSSRTSVAVLRMRFQSRVRSWEVSYSCYSEFLLVMIHPSNKELAVLPQNPQLNLSTYV